ncbi:MAG: hypothetical protein PHP23_01775 [Desulfobacterales bacterium]|nr:hypothetical protein [Desulfobacterales bacterium]MDD4073703.1 hypothetical protein [Desulfobacterales bacterium]MDD4391416.1 hypothetical protein [Desulfobacterales bacterium]
MTLSLNPIKPKLVADQVFDQLRELIFRGQLKAGEKLMPGDVSLKDLLEVRLGLECNAAAWAARRAVDTDLECLEKSLAHHIDIFNAIKRHDPRGPLTP